MIYPNGKAETTPKGMANVFREFYEDLYAAKGAPTTKERSKPIHKTKQQAKLPRVTIKEIDKALKELKNGKCKDTKHVTAEIIKHAGIKAKNAIADICTDIIRGGDVPDSWRKNTINVLHKGGPTHDAANYRPICILDISYKVLARIIYSRIILKIDAAQSVDQAGFRKEFSTDDHLLTSTILIEKVWKSRKQLWICAVDFQKAFDSVKFDAIWEALKECEVEEGYIELLKSLYSGQKGVVKFQVQSDDFNIERGTKQGDPVSTALFNAVLEVCMRKTKRRWRSCGTKGTPCGFLIKNKEDVIKETNWCKNNQYLTNLRFADDLLIIAKSNDELSRMMSVLKDECTKVGLEMHTQKTQVLTNGINDHSDNRREILKHFNEKLNDEKKAKLARKQKLKGKKPEQKGQSRKGNTKVKKSNTKKGAAKKYQKPQGTTCTNVQEGETTVNNKKRDTPKDCKDKAGDNLILKDGTSIRILSPNEHVKYLGKQLNLINHTDKDIDERIRKGWMKFSEFKQCSKIKNGSCSSQS